MAGFVTAASLVRPSKSVLDLEAFYPAKPPFPLMHIDTTWKFREMIQFRDATVRRLGVARFFIGTMILVSVVLTFVLNLWIRR